MKYKILIALGVLFFCALSAWFFKDRLTIWLKAEGHIEYTPDEAVTLAYSRCGGCHNAAKITNYCSRCGPPFIIVVHNMRTLIALEKGKPGREHLKDLTDHEAAAIVQVWNALIGNWEEGWRKEDLAKMLQGDKALIDLLQFSPAERKIEAALYGKKAPGVAMEEGLAVKETTK